MIGSEDQAAVSDHAVGSFKEDGPWIVDPESMPWRVGIDEIRQGAAARVPQLIRRRWLPPRRGGTIVTHLGAVTLPWFVRDRRKPDGPARLAAALRPAFEQLGCTFIKLGQLIASGEGMMPAEWVEEFRICRDHVPAESLAHVRGVIEEDFGRPLEVVFESFDPVPLAAASIAQVHAARLIGGQEVVVKVQRPHIDRIVAGDIATLAWLAPIIERINPQASVANLPAYIEMFADTIVEELDFRLEAQNMLDIAHELAAVDPRSIIIARPHTDLVTRRVLVMERLYGHPVDDEAALVAAGIDVGSVFRALMISFLEGAMVNGVFHGDLHAGNMLVDSRGRPAIFDFGITGRLDEPKRQALMGLLFSTSSQDGRALLRHFRDLGGFPPDADLEQIAVETNIDELMQQTPGQMSAEDTALQMRETMNRLVAHGARLPKALFLYMKGMVYLSGAIARVAADIDMSAEIVHIFEVFTRDHADRLSAVGLDVDTMPDGDTVAERVRRQMGIEGDSMTFADMRQAQAAQSNDLRSKRRG